MTFLIREGGRARVREVQLTGVSSVPDQDIRKRLWARPSRPFDPAYLQLDTLAISLLYQERGYRPHVVGRSVRDSLDVTVRYDVDEGARYRVGEVFIIRPDQRYQVDESLIRRELVVEEGDYYNLTRIRRSQERLYESGLFSQVAIEALPDSSQTRIDFQVMVRERKPRWLDAAIGSGSTERYVVSGQWGHRNLLGRGLSGALSTELSADEKWRFKRWRAQAALLEPWLFNTRTRAQLTPYYELVDDRANPAEYEVLHQQFVGVDLQFRRELTSHFRVLLTQKNVVVNQEVEFTQMRMDTATAAELEEAESQFADEYSTHRLELALERDYRDNLFLPSRGSVQTLIGQIAGFRGTSTFGKMEFFSNWYTPLANGMVLASRIRLGTLDPFGEATPPRAGAEDPEVAQVPLEDRFRTGGVNSIRGFNENAIPPQGGLTVIQGNLELRIPTRWRIPFLGPLGLEMFMDAGNVWTRAKYIKWENFRPGIGSDELGSSDVRYVAGVGPRIDLPIGPLRVDFTWPFRPSPGSPRPHGDPGIQFAIGPSF